MFDRLAMRALFWGALAILAGVGGLMSVGTTPLYALSPDTDPTAVLSRVLGIWPSFVDAAPFLSLAALALAIAGWRMLNREILHRGARDHASHARMRQWQEALQMSAEGVFLLKAVRNLVGAVVDFEITDINPSAARLLRGEATDLLGKRLSDTLPSAASEYVIARYVDAINAHSPMLEELRVNPRTFAAGWLYHQAVPTAEGIAVTLKDISQRKREELRLRRASLTDELTRLYNRRGFLTLADQQLRIARRQEKDAVLLYVDLDDFKPLNDRYGHAEGDRALAAVGRLLRRAVRECDVVARMGGDEFTIMALDADRAAARLIQKRIEERVTLLNASGELSAPISLTIGHTRVRPSDTASLGELLARADALLYARKKRRKLTQAVSASATARARSRSTLGRSPVSAPAMVVPPDVAAIARATAVAAAARVPASMNSVNYNPTRVA